MTGGFPCISGFALSHIMAANGLYGIRLTESIVLKAPGD